MDPMGLPYRLAELLPGGLPVTPRVTATSSRAHVPARVRWGYPQGDQGGPSDEYIKNNEQGKGWSTFPPTGVAAHRSTQHSTTRHITTQARHSTTQHSTAHGTAQPEHTS